MFHRSSPAQPIPSVDELLPATEPDVITGGRLRRLLEVVLNRPITPGTLNTLVIRGDLPRPTALNSTCKVYKTTEVREALRKLVSSITGNIGA